MTHRPDLTTFRTRFDSLLGRMRRVRLGTALCAAAIGLSLSAALLAAADYRWEFALGARRILLAVFAGSVTIVLLRSLWHGFRRWSVPATAAELEGRFPELGQRVRTTLQYGGETAETIAAEGVTPSLVNALLAETNDRTSPLALDVVIPKKRFLIAACLTALVILGLLLSAAINREWRIALGRTLLADVPYTTLAVQPGNASIVEGAHLDVRLELLGRTDRTVTLLSRNADNLSTSWSEETLDTATGKAGNHVHTLETRFSRITAPMEYRAVVSSRRGKVIAESQIYRVNVRYPLAIQSVETAVALPEYTGLGTRVVKDGSITALRGSSAEFRITLDRPPAKADLRVTPRSGATNESRTVPVRVTGSIVSADLSLDADFDWSLEAQSADGTPLPDNGYRVRVHDDRAPQISFSEPDDSLEVQPLAEVLMQVRASDDYGLSRSGIVFQVSSDEEHTLLAEDFAEVARAAADVAETGQITPRTRATLERVLPLEHFALTQKDCVVYYAFAEDNFPGTPHRAETDLRFIDIRPFKMIYRLMDPDDNMPAENRRRLASLEELIRRQRYALNRTIKLEKFPDRWGDGELSSIDRLTEYETELAQGTRELAQFLESRGNDIADVLFQAEAAMLAAVDSLSIGQYDISVLQEKDAQQRLVEARNRLEVAITKDRALATALRQVDRRITQKLRRPRSDEEEKRRERVVQRLVQLAINETSVADSLASMSEGRSSAGSKPDPAEQPPNEVGDPSARNESTPASAEASELEQVQDRQSDIVTEANDLMRVLETYDEITELAKQRIKAAAAMADTASADLSGSDTEAAARAAGQAAEQFRELARQAAALLAGETPQQVAAARDVAADLAYRGRELASQLEPADERGGGGSQTEEEEKQSRSRVATPADEARRMREAARTLQDIMKSIATSQKSTNAEAMDRVAELLDRGDVNATIDKVNRLSERVAAKSPLKESLLDVREAGERMEITARELDKLYRSLVMPRVEQVKDIERQVAQLIQQMTSLGSTAEVREWERAASELMEKLEKEGVGAGVRDEIEAMLGEARTNGGGWLAMERGFLVPPGRYVAKFQLLLETIEQHIQELLLADLRTLGDEAVPPGFEALVQRYMQVLANEARHK
jgi:Domain of unknown function (DUF4175)